MTEATPSDVRSLIDPSLSDDDIQTYLDRAQEDNQRVNDVDAMDQTQIRRVEELLASIKILSLPTSERSASDKQVGNARKTYERGRIEQLRADLSKWDPSGQLGSSVVWDSDRNVTTGS
ncbi:hypothetical protein [Halostagnicola kamekurae]|uniref:Uncharacterized protein n=1 Tax=Halostagnicola kamekurae TaxID=619731 RepID=A0A1I6RE49_9EURY|nr:hypothetical protein [Halostagnicola kamekurae]SFS62999.1 hypothetical protein SAMN04488556_1733 [Halostagnicola kamekurae]